MKLGDEAIKLLRNVNLTEKTGTLQKTGKL